MRIASLDLLAFGPFQGLALDFSAPGLHVVFGRNEAGKSTTLRAISSLLFGIDARTPDAHLHKPADLRIGGTLLGEGGERVSIVRRKGVSKGGPNTLLDPHGQAIDETVVSRLFRGVTEETFRNAFGLDHDTLQLGAEALLAGRGDLGESIFDASVGGGGEVQRLLKQLTDEADGIYKPRGSTLPLNDALKTLANAQKQIKEKERLPDAYAAQARALDEQSGERAALQKRRVELATRRALVDRVRQRLPRERRRTALCAEIAALGEIARQPARLASLGSRLVAYDKSRAAWHELVAEAARLGDRVVDAARRAGVEPASLPTAIRVDAKTEGRIQHLLTERSRLATRLESARVEIARIERELARQRELSASAKAVPDVTRLVRAADGARALGDVETRHAAEVARVSRQRDTLEQRARALGCDGALKAVVALSVPSSDTLEHLAARAREVDRRIMRLDERASELEVQALAVDRQIAEQTGDFAPPEASDLRTARAARVDAWERARVAEARDRPDLERAFELAMRDADDVADRMIREADRVTLLARLRQSRAELAKQRTLVEVDGDRARRERRTIDDEHALAWAPTGVAPAGMEEMRAWRGRHTSLVEACAALRESELDVDEIARSIEVARAELDAALAATEGVTPAGRRLADFVAAAVARIDRAASTRQAAAIAAEEIAKLEAQRDPREISVCADAATLADVGQRLAELVRPLGVADDASETEVRQLLDAWRVLFGVIDERAAVASRAAAAAAEVKGFESEVGLLVGDLAPDLAGVSTHDAATALAERAQRAQAASRDLATLEAELTSLGGEAVPDDIAKVASEPEGALAALEEIDEKLEDIEREMSRVDQRIGGLRMGLEEMRVDSGAAEASASAEEALARVRAHVERFCRAKLAAFLLSREIERYREENQGPMLASASQLFSRLTLSAFTGVRAGFDDHDKPAIACVRASGSEVPVAGLSEGTRDQLYLSLRLASLLRHADVGAPMPLVLDDVLVQFDDERSRAALVVLAELASHMQVLFFTHHARLVELARESVPGPSLHVHDLSTSTSTARAACAS